MSDNIKLTEQDVEDFKLNMAQMEEQIAELNTSIKVLYFWADRMGIKFKKKYKIIKLSDFSL